MQKMVVAGNRTDALLPLMRLPDNALSLGAYAEWAKKLRP